MGGMPVEHAVPGLVLIEHEFLVPLDQADPGGERITVFAREVADPDGRDKPFLVFLQGGPGFEAPRPTRAPTTPGWIDRALQDFRVLMLDQRGTGRSTPVGDLAGLSPQQQADRLACFRADSIVRDAEWIRRELGVDRWSLLGQSFGGLCAFTYLSLAPEGLREVLVTGGVPVLGPRVDEVFALTYAKAIERSRRFYARYPEDRARVLRLLDEPVRLPGGDLLTRDRVRQLGHALGMSDGAERLHHLLELPPDSPAFRHDAEAQAEFSRNPIYAVLHEACWADGGSTRWSADRLLPDAYAAEPELLTAEHITRSQFAEHTALVPLAEAADLLAAREWPRLYDPEVLADNEVPVAAAIYLDDLYVPRELSEETAAQVRGLRAWRTDEYEHNGLRADGARIVGRLLDLARGRA